MKVSVLGCGRWGSFIAWYLDKIGKKVILWGRTSSKNLERIIKTGQNDFIKFPSSIKLTNDLDYAVRTSEVLVISVSSQSVRKFMEMLSEIDLSKKIIVLCMKGLEVETGKRLSEVVSEFTRAKIAIWAGPGHVQDFVNGMPNCMVIDSEDEEIKSKLISEFSSDLIRFYYGKDLIGNEIGAAAKNVIGIAAGMLDGANRPNLKGALMSRGTREIARLIKAMGGNEISAYGLCHLGDYQATLFSEYSHNRKFGEAVIKGENYDELAEGVPTTKAILKLGEKYNVDLPICKAVYDIIYEKRDPEKVISNLFTRSLKKEF